MALVVGRCAATPPELAKDVYMIIRCVYPNTCDSNESHAAPDCHSGATLRLLQKRKERGNRRERREKEGKKKIRGDKGKG